MISWICTHFFSFVSHTPAVINNIIKDTLCYTKCRKTDPFFCCFLTVVYINSCYRHVANYRLLLIAMDNLFCLGI